MVGITQVDSKYKRKGIDKRHGSDVKVFAFFALIILNKWHNLQENFVYSNYSHRSLPVAQYLIGENFVGENFCWGEIFVT